MMIPLSEEAHRYVADQVAAGRYPSEQAVLEAALSHMRRGEQSEAATAGGDPIAGMFGDDPGLIDEIVEEAMAIRERRPWRLPAGE